jgi:hypothetical protein
MKIEIKTNTPSEDYKEAFIAEVNNIHPLIKEMIVDKNVSMILVDRISDIQDRQAAIEMKDYYKYERKEEKTRGLTSDVIHCIAIAYNTTPKDFIKAILYHELGHFLDLYEVYGNVTDISQMTFSADERFIQAYKKDIEDHYELIKQDDNYALKHFIQSSTPGNLCQSAICETFAELYRLSHNIENSTKTVELYFPTALEVSKVLVKEKYNL